MAGRGSRRRAAAALALLLVPAGMATARASAQSPPPAAGFTANVRADSAETGQGQNEPQVSVDQTGRSYVTWQSSTGGHADAAASTTDGTSFTYLGNYNNDPNSATDIGDVDTTTTTWPAAVPTPAQNNGDNGIFAGELGQQSCGAINIINAASTDQGHTWSAVDASCQVAQVDRPWIAAYTPAAFRGTSAAVAHTWVYNEYHDFGLSNIWVSRSSNGGSSYDPAQHSAIQLGSTASLTTTCNTIPGGIAVDQNGPHAGRVYVVWQTSDLPSNAQGCNYTQAQAFDHLFLSYSDDNGITWTSTTVYNDPCAPAPPAPPADATQCQDISELFTPVAVDDAGNVYVAFARRDISSSNPEYDMDVAASTDGGNSFSLHVANTDTGTHYAPWIAAGGNGGVDVVYYRTPYVEGVGQSNKPAAAPGSAQWNVYMSQSLDGGGTWTESQVSDHANYFGDFCTTGIFCGLAPSSFNWGQDRILFDDFGVAIGPDGGARIAWTDSRDSWSSTCAPGGTDDSNVACQRTHVYFACQSSGVGLHGETVTGCGKSSAPVALPEAPSLPLLVLVAAAVLGPGMLIGRRRARRPRRLH